MQVAFKSSVVLRLLTPALGWVCLVGLALLAGCGQKGPLMLPAPQPAASAAASR